MIFGNIHGYSGKQTLDRKGCNVCLHRCEWSFFFRAAKLLREKIWGRLYSTFQKWIPRRNFWQLHFLEFAAFSQIKKAPKMLFTLLSIESQMSSAKIIFIPTLGPSCVRTVCWNHKEAKLPCKPLTPGSSQEASCELCLELCEALLSPKSWDSEWWNEKLKVTRKASTLRPPPSPGPTQNVSKTDTFQPPLTTLAHFSLFPGVCPWVQGPQFLPHPEARQVQGCWFWIYVTCPSWASPPVIWKVLPTGQLTACLPAWVKGLLEGEWAGCTGEVLRRDPGSQAGAAIRYTPQW